jgi:membrane associated rhomboid family serine protease
MDVRQAIAALYDSKRSQRPVVTYAFLAACWLVTVASTIEPRLYDVLGGVRPRRHVWQLFTAVFEHGGVGFPGLVHLLLNTFLILECGRPCERLLGSFRFAASSVMAMMANAVALHLTEGVNGSSLIIWAWGPPLWWALRWARHVDAAASAMAGIQRIQQILVLMYGVLVVVMGFLPYAAGWRGNPLVALAMGNLFHAVATATGVVVAWFWRDRIHRRLAWFAG